MSAFDFVIKQGDTQPSFVQTITDSTGAPLNLTGATVTLVVRALTSSDVLINATATIVDATAGKVAYSFSATDTAEAGTYLAQWLVADVHGQTFSIPTDGYLSISIEGNLSTPGGGQIVTLGEVKDHLTIPASDKTRDAKLARMANDLIPVVEHITGPIVQRQVEEWHDGGQEAIVLRQRPVVRVDAISEYRASQEWQLSLIGNPSQGSIYSAQFEAPSRVVRRGPGGTVLPFAPGKQAVHVVYTAGRTEVPANVRLGMLELIRINFSQTQARPLLRGWPTDGTVDEQEPGAQVLGFFVPNRVRELLAPSRRAPGVF